MKDGCWSHALDIRSCRNGLLFYRTTFWSLFVTFFVACVVASGTFVSAAELSLPEIEETIKNFKRIHGRAISNKEVWETLSKSQSDIPADKYLSLWSLIREQQIPSISLGDLVALVKAKRDSIQTIDVQMHSERVYLAENGQASSDRSWKQDDHLIFSGNKTFCETTRVTRGVSIPSASYRIAYDGENRRTVHKPHGEVPAGAISATYSQSMLVPLPNPLSGAMLLDSETILRMPIHNFDLACLIERTPSSTLFEEPVTIDHTRSLVIDDGALFRVFLDPARDFSVVRLESFLPEFYQDGHIRVTQGRSLERVLELNNLHDYGNGIFLPLEIIDTYFRRGRSSVVATVRTDSLGLNRHIPESVFRDIIPENAIVADHTHGGVVYKQSDSASIGELLEDAVKPKQTTLLRTISIIVGVLVIGIVVLRHILLRRKAA